MQFKNPLKHHDRPEFTTFVNFCLCSRQIALHSCIRHWRRVCVPMCTAWQGEFLSKHYSIEMLFLLLFFFHASAVCSWEVRTALGCAWTNCKCKRNFACFLSRWTRDVAVTSCYVLSTKRTKIDSIPLICWQTINNRRKKLLYTIQLSRTTLFQNKQCDVDCICIWFVCQNQTMPQGRVVMKRNLVKFTVFETTFKTYHSYFNICKTIRGK